MAQLEATLTDELGVAQPFTEQVQEFRPEALHEILEESGVDVLALDCTEYPCLVEIVRGEADLERDLGEHGLLSRFSSADSVVLQFSDSTVPFDERRWAHRVRMLQTWGTTAGGDGLP